MKDIGHCEKCNSSYRLEAHHIKSKASGGGDIKDNLICLCWICHRVVHDGNISRAELKKIVGERT